MEGVVTLQQAREYIELHKEKGCICLACDQHAKIYRRSINSTMVKSLISLAKYSTSDYVHLSEVLKEITVTGTGDFGKLKYWGLVEEMPNSDKKKKYSGYWRITDKGCSFIIGEQKVPKYVLVYNANVIGFDGEEIDVNDAYKQTFDIREIL